LQQYQQQATQLLGLVNGETFEGVPLEWAGRAGPPPSPQSLSADSNRPWQRRKRCSSSKSRGRLSSRRDGLENVDCGAESESSMTSSTHLSLGQPYIPSLPDDSSEAEADADGDTVQKDSTDSHPSSQDAGVCNSSRPPESSVHQAPVTSLVWTDSL